MLRCGVEGLYCIAPIASPTQTHREAPTVALTGVGTICNLEWPVCRSDESVDLQRMHRWALGTPRFVQPGGSSLRLLRAPMGVFSATIDIEALQGRRAL